MSRTRLSPIDILGITLGTIALLVVIASVAVIVRGSVPAFSWSDRETSRFGHEKRSHPGALREEKDEQIAGDFTTLEIRNIGGSIDIRGGAGNAVAVRSVKTAMFPTALENVTVGIEKQGNRLLIEERHEGGFLMSAGTVSFDITVPQGVKAIEAHSISGSVTVIDVPPGIDQRLSTISGSISTSRAANLDASSTSGSIQFAFAGRELDAHTVSGSIEGRIDSLDRGGSVMMRSVSGSVGIDAFPGLDATVSLHSISGGVSCEFPVAAMEQKRNSLRGRIGGGAGRMEITTTSGPITVRKM